MALNDTVGAFCDYGPVDLQTVASGPLAGLTFAVKDLYDVAGLPTGAGSPDWLATHPIPQATAPCVSRLLAAGARLVGKTHTDELAWSLAGQNHHYGTPINTAAPDRIPGGSSSGSAAATAAGLVDFALGSDTGGSVRLPASYGGLYGIRTTHGRIPLDGVVPLAPSYDTVGWFARDAAILARVGAAILPDAKPARRPDRVLIATDLFTLAGNAVTAALAPAVERLSACIGRIEHISLAEGALSDWREAFRLCQSADAWAAQGPWITQARPPLGPGVRERFAAAAEIGGETLAGARRLRAAIRARMNSLVPPGTVVLAPLTAGVAPRRTASDDVLAVARAAALGLLCAAGHAGLPEIALPVALIDGCPLGLGVMAASGEDEALLALAAETG